MKTKNGGEKREYVTVYSFGSEKVDKTNRFRKKCQITLKVSNQASDFRGLE